MSTKPKRRTSKSVRQALQTWCETQGLSTARVDEYMQEFEHQDGEECWEEYFQHMSGVIEDFVLYTREK